MDKPSQRARGSSALATPSEGLLEEKHDESKGGLRGWSFPCSMSNKSWCFPDMSHAPDSHSDSVRDWQPVWASLPRQAHDLPGKQDGRKGEQAGGAGGECGATFPGEYGGKPQAT